VDTGGTGNIRVAITVVLGSDTNNVDAGLHAQACVPTGLDIYYVLDSSASMAEAFQGATTKLDAAKAAIAATNDFGATWDNGTRVGLIGYYGNNPSGGNQAGAILQPVDLTDIYTDITDAFPFIQPRGSTPTSHAMRAAGVEMANNWNGVNKPVVILLTDGVPTVDYFAPTFGRVYLDADVQAVDVRDGSGGFRSIADVRVSGVAYPSFGTFAGEPLATTMEQTLWTLNSSGVPNITIHGIAIQGAQVFNDGIVDYIRTQGNGIFSRPEDLNELLNALEAAIEDSGCP
jgi:hypothetical protein